MSLLRAGLPIRSRPSSGGDGLRLERSRDCRQAARRRQEVHLHPACPACPAYPGVRAGGHQGCRARSSRRCVEGLARVWTDTPSAPFGGDLGRGAEPG